MAVRGHHILAVVHHQGTHYNTGARTDTQSSPDGQVVPLAVHGKGGADVAAGPKEVDNRVHEATARKDEPGDEGGGGARCGTIAIRPHDYAKHGEVLDNVWSSMRVCMRRRAPSNALLPNP